MSFLVNPYLYASSACVDADAVAFLSAAAITDPTITSAICTLVTSMKANGTWAKCSAIYPMVGGTATTHKFNLKNPLDTNAAFRLSFVGGWTHSSGGALPNGTNAYANTFLNPTITLNFTSNSFGIYSRTNNVTGTRAYGAFQGSFLLQNNLTGGNFVSGQIASLISYTANPSTSLLMSTRTTSTLFTAYRAGVLLGTNTALVSALPNVSFYLGARNGNNIAEFFTNHQIAFAFLGSGLNSIESVALYTSVQAMQTTLSRQV
jgi:hypothetical protein